MANLPPIYSWRIYCNTEQAFVTGYSPTALTTCPNDTTHTVNANSVQQLALLNSPAIAVTDNAPTTAYFQASSVQLVVPAPTSVPVVITTDFSFPFDLYLWEMSYVAPATNIGDTMSIQVGPDTMVGVTTATTAAAATSVSVNSTVLNYVVKGSEIGISDGTNTEYPGLVTAVNATAGTITFQTPLVNSYATGSKILFSIYSLKNVVLDTTERYTIGSKGLNTKIIPAGTTIRVLYTNNTNNASQTTVTLQLQYYYQ